jgi:hypothetical protein
MSHPRDLEDDETAEAIKALESGTFKGPYHLPSFNLAVVKCYTCGEIKKVKGATAAKTKPIPLCEDCARRFVK